MSECLGLLDRVGIKHIFDYPTGDFVDDYMIDQDERNDLSFLFILEADQGRIARIRLHPTCIEDLGVRLVNDQERDFLAQTMRAKCTPFGTAMGLDREVVIVEMK